MDLRVGAYLDWGRHLHSDLAGLALDGWAAHPVAGRDYPRGVSWGVGIAWERQFGPGESEEDGESASGGERGELPRRAGPF